MERASVRVQEVSILCQNHLERSEARRNDDRLYTRQSMVTHVSRTVVLEKFEPSRTDRDFRKIGTFLVERSAVLEKLNLRERFTARAPSKKNDRVPTYKKRVPDRREKSQHLIRQ